MSFKKGAKKQKREEILAKIFPFNDLKTIVLNSLQATVIKLFPVAQVKTDCLK